jgi:lipopolysaccharide export LptBFGC system permease protein LptF
MKKLVPIFAAFAGILLIYSCSQPAPAANKKLEGNWKSKDGTTKLSITDKDFIMDDGQPSKEDYFVKSDTIYTSYQGADLIPNFALRNLRRVS